MNDAEPIPLLTFVEHGHVLLDPDVQGHVVLLGPAAQRRQPQDGVLVA